MLTNDEKLLAAGVRVKLVYPEYLQLRKSLEYISSQNNFTIYSVKFILKFNLFPNKILN